MIGLEALLQGVVGFALGLALAWALLHGMGAVDFASLGGGADMLGARLPETMRMFVHPASVADAAFVSLVTALSGGLVPAVRASRLKPVEATRYV
jgi:ABC-type antimicrobial peptide transport system permease subunit